MSEVRICRAEPGDERELARIGAKTFSDKFAHLYAPEDLEAFLQENHAAETYVAKLADTSTGIWKAMRGEGEIVGYAVAGPCGLPVENMPVGAMEISRLYVDGDYQSAGLGRKLMSEMLAWVDRHGPAPLYLSVYKFNDGAQRFYGRYGFEFLKEYRYKVGNHYDPEYVFARVRR